jgi:hypothetical protein
MRCQPTGSGRCLSKAQYVCSALVAAGHSVTAKVRIWPVTAVAGTAKNVSYSSLTRHTLKPTLVCAVQWSVVDPELPVKQSEVHRLVSE